MNQWRTVVGLMSGTSVDGIDAVLVETDGLALKRSAQAEVFPYRDKTRDLIWAAISEGEAFDAQSASSQSLAMDIAFDHANAVKQLMQNEGQAQLIGFHGQTIWHAPEKSLSIQLGNPQHLAELTGIDVIHSFRQADLAEGGQGAPLAPVYHRALIDQMNLDLPAVIVNIGGVSNLSYWDGNSLIGFDCGPGNSLMDDYMREHFGEEFDLGGAVALKGQVDNDLVSRVLKEPEFTQKLPKSFDRQSFAWLSKQDELRRLAEPDVMATLAAITVGGIVSAIKQLPIEPRIVIVAGGGQYNRALMNALETSVDASVQGADDMNMPGEFLEAELMAYLAVRFQRQLPSSWPTTTGAAKPVVGGELCRAMLQSG